MSNTSFSSNSLNTEINCLREIDAIVKESFDECCFIPDVLEFNNDKISTLEKMKATMEQFSDLQKQVTSLGKIAKKLQNELTDLDECNEEELNEYFEETLLNMKERRHEEQHKAAITAVAEAISSLQQTGADEDSELLVTQNTEHYKDPITKLRIEDPVKSKTCGHYYERNSILNFIQSKPKKCPYSGCPNTLRKDDLIDDVELRDKL